MNTELLDHFAGLAMTVLLEQKQQSVGYNAYRIADEMLQARESLVFHREKEEKKQRAREESDIRTLNLPIRYERCLTAEEIYSINYLLEWPMRDIKRIPNLGAKGIKFIEEALALKGLELRK